MKVNKKRIMWAGAAGIAATALAAITIKEALKPSYLPLEVVPDVDFNKYSGEWYEIARLPVRYEKDCFKSKAAYQLADNGTIDIVNTCHLGNPNGKLRKTMGKGFIPDPENKAKLKVQFRWPFRGDYQIIALGEDYEYAMVGTPDRKGLWIMSRSHDLNITIMKDLLDIASDQGFDVSQLVFIPHQ